MRLNRRLIAGGLFLFLVLLIVINVFIFKNKKSEPVYEDRLVVLTTIFPLQEFATFVGGERVLVSSLLPAGVDPHHFEPRPSDLKRLYGADLFIYGGEALEPGIAQFLNSLESSSLEILDASRESVLIIDAADQNQEDTLQAKKIDPHFWLDFENDKKIVLAISKKLSTLDLEHAPFYEQRANEYQEKLENLDRAYRAGLEGCAYRQIIFGGHHAFAYLAERYNLNYLTAQGLSPDAEPGAQTLINLSQQAKKQSNPYVFFEEGESAKVAEVIAVESGAKLLPLNSGHSLSPSQKEAGFTFIKIMENNLNNLRQGLSCQ